MAKLTKKQKLINEKVEAGKLYDFADAVELLKSLPTSKFEESFDVSINLGIDSRKSDQNVRGACVLPNGTGKTVRVAVFAQGDNAAKATDAGADVVGFEDLAEQIKGGDLNFDVVIATPDAMRVVGQLGQILGPRGLMPNPKVGTVTPDVVTAVNNAKSGQVRFRADKGGIVHCSIGKADFDAAALQGNLDALLVNLQKVKPASAKGIYLKKISVSTTHGPGLAIEKASLESIK
ncbi:MAG: 50S ribosomal protein L1 [gamma proteobacterium symbiont of Taylorina sp.]|nr:50S ribosomal protein L1 [gamma proteobacterium symbiont of Taylorina sp.]